MAQIKKYLKGKELARISEQEQQINTLLSDPNVDLNLKDQALSIQRWAQAVVLNDNMTSRDERRYRTGINDAILNVFFGKPAYNQAMIGSATLNTFGYYSRPETNWMVNETARLALQPSQQTVTTSVPGTSGSYIVRDPYYWHWDNQKFDINNVRADMTSDEKISLFISILLEGLNDYVSLSGLDNKIVHNAPDNASERFPIFISQLNEIKNLSTPQAKLDALLPIITELSKTSPEIASIYNQFFNAELNPSAEVLAARQAERQAAATQQTLSKFDTYKTYFKVPITDSPDSYFVLLDPTKADYLNLIILDLNGNQKSRYNLATDFGQLDPALWQTISNNIRTAIREKFPISDYTQFGGTKGIDFSNYFPGEDIIFVNPENYTDESIWLPYDLLFANIADWKNKFKYAGNTDVSANGLGINNQYVKNNLYDLYPESLKNIPDLTEEYVNTHFGVEGDNYGDINNSTPRLRNDRTLSQMTFSRDATINKLSLLQKLKLVLSYYLASEIKTLNKTFEMTSAPTPDGRTLVDLFMDLISDDTEKYAMLLKSIIYDSTVDNKYRLLALDEYKRLEPDNTQIESEKMGGILKFLLGGSPLARKQSKLQTYSTSKKTSSVNLPSDSDKETGLYISLASAFADLALMFDPEPWSSGIISAGILAANQIADEYLDIPVGERIFDGAVDLVGGVASVIPIIGNATQYPKLAYRCARIGKVLSKIGIPASAIAAYFGIKDTATQNSLEKLLHEGLGALDKEELRHLVRIATSSVGFTKLIQNLNRSAKGIIKQSDTPEFIQAKKAGKNEYVAIDQTKVDAANTERKKALDNLSWWNFLKKRAANKAYAEAITPEGYTPVVSTNGKVNTEFNYIVDPTKANEREGFILGHPYWSYNHKSPSDIQQYNPNENFGAIVSKWWNNLKLNPLAWSKTYPILKTSVKIGKNNIDLIGIPKSYSEDALKLFDLNQVKVKPSKVPAEIKAITKDNDVFAFSPNPKNPKEIHYVYTIAEKKRGGKLDRLINYINNK